MLGGGGTYRDFQAAFVAAWPRLRAYLFVDDHPYWKDHKGELAPGDVIGQPGVQMEVRGDARVDAVGKAVLQTLRLNLEIYRADGSWPDYKQRFDDLDAIGRT
jgi:hypothetical protein